MKKLKNQTLWQCGFCKKRLLTKHGCAIHEESYCSHPDSINQKEIKAHKDFVQATCFHHNQEEIWSYIPGEAVKQPDYMVCRDCGKRT